MRFRVAALAGLILALLGLCASAGQAHAATSSLTISGDPTEEKPVTVTVRGQTENTRYLWVVAFPEAKHGCDANDANQFAYWNSNGTPLLRGALLQPGSYERTATFTPPRTGSYRVCSLVAADNSAAPDAKAGLTFQARQGRATSSIVVSSDPTEQKPVTVTIKGETEVSRSLWVVAFPENSHACDSGDANEFAYWSSHRTPLLRYEPLQPGSYERTATFTPPKAGSYRICSLVAEDITSQPIARASRTIQARERLFQMTVTPEGPIRHLARSEFSVTGTTESDAEVTVTLHHGVGPCPAGYLAQRRGTARTSVSEHPVEAGRFEVRGWVIPRAAWTVRFCIYLHDLSGGSVGIASTDVSVRRNPVFVPKLITPTRARGYGRAPLFTWRNGPDINRIDLFHIFDRKPKMTSGARGIYLDGRTVKFSFRKSLGISHARVTKKLPYGRYWWRVIRNDRESGYWESSRPRTFLVKPPSKARRSRR